MCPLSDRQAGHLQSGKRAVSQSKESNMEVLMWFCTSCSCKTKGNPARPGVTYDKFTLGKLSFDTSEIQTMARVSVRSHTGFCFFLTAVLHTIKFTLILSVQIDELMNLYSYTTITTIEYSHFHHPPNSYIFIYVKPHCIHF